MFDLVHIGNLIAIVIIPLSCLIVLSQSCVALSKNNVSIRIGTRPSPLARQQAESVAFALEQRAVQPELVLLKSLGEHAPTKQGATQETSLAQMSNPVDFVTAIDEAVVNGNVDMGVHSLKDIPPDARWVHANHLKIAACLPRRSPFDVLISPCATNLQSLPPNAKVGSSSLRRQAQILNIRPDLEIVHLRGNIHQRLEYLRDGIVDALVLAEAGVNRLGLVAADHDFEISLLPELLPAPGQGIVGIVCRHDNVEILQLLKSVNDSDALLAATAERAVLGTLDDCSPWKGRPPMAAYMHCNDECQLDAMLASPMGEQMHKTKKRTPHPCTLKRAETLGSNVGRELLKRATESNLLGLMTGQ